jgi:hypothetical protein
MLILDSTGGAMKRTPIKTGNKPCVKCGQHVTCMWKRGHVVRVCDECGFEEDE